MREFCIKIKLSPFHLGIYAPAISIYAQTLETKWKVKLLLFNPFIAMVNKYKKIVTKIIAKDNFILNIFITEVLRYGIYLKYYVLNNLSFSDVHLSLVGRFMHNQVVCQSTCLYILN